MLSIARPRKPLPPLEVGSKYLAADFERYEYFGSMLTGSKAIIRLHLKNGTTIDLPSTDNEFKHLLVMLCEAFPQHAIEHAQLRKWKV